jgi:Polyketide cyclase / dehydrase and lipid transport
MKRKPILTTILTAIAAIIVVFVIIIATRPADFRITRSATISAPAAVVFAQVNDLRKWEAWSPWEKIDPALRRTFEGSSMGTGAIYRWAGNNKVGEGSMTIMESRPGESIQIKLEFLKPFKATDTAEFTFKSEGNQTVVTWSMFGTNNFMAKALGLFVDWDKMVGSDFERGLAQLKSVAEASSKT